MSKESYLQKVVLMESVETDSGDIGSAEMYSVDIGSAETDILKNDVLYIGQWFFSVKFTADIRKSGNNGRKYCQKSSANILEN